MKKKEYLIYSSIILLQILVVIFWAGQKVNYFSDEFMTMGYTRGLTGMEPTARYVTLSPEWTYNEWHSNSEFKSQFLMSERTALWKMPFFECFKLLIKGRNYFWLLNIVESIVGFSAISNVPAVILNSILFILAELALLSLLKKLSVSFVPKCLALSLFGFSSYFISMTIYVRFYILVTLFYILMLNLIWKFWEDERINQMICHGVGIFALAYFSFKNSELVGPYFGCTSLFFLIALLITKRWKQLLIYSSMCVGGVLYVYFFTGFIQTILQPEGRGGMDAIIVSSITSDTLEFMASYKEWALELVSDRLFGFTRIILGCLIVLTGYTLVRLRIRKESQAEAGKFEVSRTAVAFLALWLLLLWVAVYRNQGILLSKAGLILTALWIVYEMLTNKGINFKVGISKTTGFALILVGASLAYSVFTSLPHLRIWRYYCFVMVNIVIVLWYLIDRLLKREPLKSVSKGWQIILTVSVVATAITPFFADRIYYIYDDDKAYIDTVRKHGNTDVILLCRPEHGQYEQYVYDCINIMSEDSSVYLVDEREYTSAEIEYSNEFILWDHHDEDTSDILKEIKSLGYNVEELGSDHVSKAYLCRIGS